MEIDLVKTLQKTEVLGEINPSNKKLMFAYKHFNNVLIRADKSLWKIYSESLKHSELQVYPNTNYKSWGAWLLNVLKIIKSGHSFNKLIGVGVNWHFKKNIELPLYADIIYLRGRSTIMVYTRTKKVVKVAITDRGKRDMLDELESQRLANAIESEGVFIPAILNEHHDKNINFSVEDYFEGRRLSFKEKNSLKIYYNKVFRFLLKFYFNNPIELQPLSDEKFISHDFVEEFMRKQDGGDEVVSIFKRLLYKEKKMILCRIHGDLSHNNILIGNDKVCIIDWGKSKQHYLARDLDNSSFDTEDTYNNFVKQAKIDDSEVYSYREQIFLARFIEMSRLIHNGIKRNTLTPYLYSLTKSENMRLLKMGQKL